MTIVVVSVVNGCGKSVGKVVDGCQVVEYLSPTTTNFGCKRNHGLTNQTYSRHIVNI